jgi:hypothetical protein
MVELRCKDDKIFCEAFAIPEGETEEQLLELGFLPKLLMVKPIWRILID